MAKKTNTKTPPCIRVEIGAKPGGDGKRDAKGCLIVGESRGASTKIDLRKDIKASSKSVLTPKKNKPCFKTTGRSGCPVQLAFDGGQPFLRFCTEDAKPGYRVNVNTPKEASEQAKKACDIWKSTGKFDFTKGTPLKGSEPTTEPEVTGCVPSTQTRKLDSDDLAAWVAGLAKVQGKAVKLTFNKARTEVIAKIKCPK